MKEKTVVITGAASGIGRSLALEMARRGARIIALDNDGPTLAGLERELKNNSKDPLVIELDISNREKVKTLTQELEKTVNSIDILINNAGIYVASPFAELDLDKFERLMQINFWGSVYCTRYFLPLLEKSPTGRIVNILSDFGLIGFPNKIAYCSSKAALRGFSNTLLTEFAGSNLSITQVYPPAVNTNLVKTAHAWDEEKNQLEAKFLEKWGMPVERVAKIIANGIQRRKAIIKISWTIKAIDWAARMFPIGIHRMIGKFKPKLDFV